MTSPETAVRVWGVIPAAGMSRRMGRPKQTLPYRDSTVVGTVTRTLLDSGLDAVVVVTRTGLVNALDLPDDARVLVAVNGDADSEMIDSIRIGLAGLTSPRDTDGVLVVPADMPALTADSCRKCIAAFSADPQRIVIATHAGRRGHPIIFPFALRATVDTLEDGLRGLPCIHPDRVHLVETSDAGAVGDIDTREDYDRL